MKKEDILIKFDNWLDAWDRYDLDAIMEWMHDDVIFENFNGTVIKGKKMLRKGWGAWFNRQRDFKFFKEDLFVDEQEQKVLFQWKLEWLSSEKKYMNMPEKREGVDVIHLKDDKIIKKLSYSKTRIEIEGKPIVLSAV